jgi:uncharacterized protein (TIRG00374 family)
MRGALKIIVGLAITVLAVFVFFKSIDDIGRLPSIIKRVKPITLLTVGFLSVLAIFFRAVRLRIILSDRPGLKSSGLFSIITVSYMLNNVLPLRLGEAARVFLVSRRYGHSIAVSLGSLIAERLLDTVGYAVLIIVPAIIFGFYSSSESILGIVPVSHFVQIISFGLLMLLSCAIFYAIRPDFTLSIIAAIRSKAPKLIAKLFFHIEEMLNDSSLWLSNPRKVALSIFWTFASILCYSTSIYIIAGDMESIITFPSACFTSGIVAFGVAIPSAPGYAGTLDLAVQAGLTLFNMGKETAAATAIIYHVAGWIAVVAVGLILWPRLNISISEIKNGAKGE